MSRIATAVAVAALAITPAAAIAQDLRSPDTKDLSQPTATKVVDLRTPDARDVFVQPHAAQRAKPSTDGSPWAVVGIAAAALACSAAFGAFLRHHRQVGRPVGA